MSTIGTVGFAGGLLGPARSGPYYWEGNIYAIGLGSPSQIEIRRSTDNGATWTMVATQTAPGTIVDYESADYAHLLNIVYHTGSEVRHVRFDMQQDSLVFEKVVASGLNPASPGVGLGKRLAGALMCVFGGASSRVMGTDYEQVYFSIYNPSTGSWSAPTIASSSQSSIIYPKVTTRNNDTSVVTFNNITDGTICFQEVSSNNSLGTVNALTENTQYKSFATGTEVGSGGYYLIPFMKGFNEAFSVTKTGVNLQTLGSVVSPDLRTCHAVAGSDMDNGVKEGLIASLLNAGAQLDLVVYRAQSSAPTLASAWSMDVLESDVTNDLRTVSLGTYTSADGSRMLGYVYDLAGVVKYGEYVLEAGQTTQTIQVTAADSGTLSVTENTSIFKTISASDSGNVSVTESSSFGPISLTATDSGSVSVTESRSFGTVSVTANDASSISVTETIEFAPATLTAADTGSLFVDDTASALVTSDERSGAETFSLSVNDSSHILKTISGADAGSVSVAESRSFGTVSVTANDSTTISVTESGMMPPINVSANDSGTVGVVEVTSFGTVAFESTDNGSLSVLESTEQVAGVTAVDAGSLSVDESPDIFIQRSASDAGTLSVNDQSGLAPIPIAAGDSGRLSITETSTIFLALEGNDSGSLAVSEQTSGYRTITANDSLDLTTYESAVVDLNRILADSGTLTVTESSEVVVSGMVEKSSDDFGSVSVTENYTAQAYLSDADLGSVSVSENSDAVASGGATKSAGDSGNVSVSESGNVYITRYITVNDSGTVSVADTAAVGVSGLITRSAADSGEVFVTDSAQMAVTIQSLSASDSGRISVSDTAELSRSGIFEKTAGDAGELSLVETTIETHMLESSDAGALSVNETTEVIKDSVVPYQVHVWDGQGWILGTMYVWNGTQWVEGVKRMWDGNAWI